MYYNETRPLTYFLCIAILAGIVILQIVIAPVKKRWLILLEVIFLVFNFSLCFVLKYPYYFGGTDTMGHLEIINRIVEDKHYPIDFSENNEYFALYHYLMAIGDNILGIRIYTACFLLHSIIAIVGVLFCYLFTKHVTENQVIAIISALIFTTTPEFISYSVYLVPRFLSLILFIGALYTYFASTHLHSLSHKLISFIFLVCIILTHHVSTPIIFAIMAFLFIVELLFKNNQQKIPDIAYIILYVVMFVGYWIYIAWEVAAPNILFWIQSLGTSKIESGTGVGMSGTSNIMPYFYYVIFLFLSVLGILFVLDKHHKIPFVMVCIAFVSLFLSVLFPPFISSIFINYNFWLGRVPLLIAPLMALMMGYGVFALISRYQLYNLVNSKISIWGTGLVCVLIIISTFFSLVTSQITSDIDLVINDERRAYFTSAELGSISFVNTSINENDLIFSDYYIVRDSYHLSGKLLRVLISPDTDYIQYGFVLVRLDALHNGGIHLSYDGGTSNCYLYTYDEEQSSNLFALSIVKENVVYNNKDVVIIATN